MTARRDAAVAGAAASLLAAWDASGLDIAVMRHVGDAAGFAWRDAWWASTVLHDGGRWLCAAMLLAMAVDAVRPLVAGPSRDDRLRGLAVTVGCLLLVPALKALSPTSCPWHLREFGGTAELVSHWRWWQADGGPGGCFPSGHATAAFAFFGGVRALRRTSARLARGWLAGVLLAGIVLGAAQVLRGAHHPSHVLWSGWLCWTVAAAVDALALRPWRKPLRWAPPVPAPGTTPWPICNVTSTSATSSSRPSRAAPRASGAPASRCRS